MQRIVGNVLDIWAMRKTISRVFTGGTGPDDSRVPILCVLPSHQEVVTWVWLLVSSHSDGFLTECSTDLDESLPVEELVRKD